MAENYLVIAKEYLKHHYAGHILAAVLFCLFAPLVVGMEALDARQSAQVMEMYLSLIGIILLVPLFLPDQNRNIRDVIASKETPVIYLHLIRLLEGLFVLTVLVLGFLFWMRQGECSFDFLKGFWGTLANGLFMGGLGICLYGLFDNLPVAYMIPMIYYICNYGGGSKYLGPFYLFSMMTGNYSQKIWLGMGGIVLAAIGILWRMRK